MVTKRQATTREEVDQQDITKHKHQSVSNGLKLKLDNLKTFTPLTNNQKLFFDAYKQGDYFIALHGVAGTGKTFCALYKAIEEVLEKTNPFNKIIVVRSAVQSREIGHLPGDVGEKMEIYEQPYRQICETLFGRKDAWSRFSSDGYKHYLVEDVGYKYNMTDLSASLGILQLAEVEKKWLRRREIFNF